VLRFHGGQADLDRELTSILAASVQFLGSPHRPDRRSGRVACPMLRVGTAVTLGHEHLHLDAEQLVPEIAEQALCPAVEHYDATVMVYDHHRVGDRFEEGLELGLHVVQTPPGRSRRTHSFMSGAFPAGAN